MLTIRLLGPPDITTPDGRVPTFTTAKSEGLFYYLVTTQQPQPHTRAALVHLFWSDIPERKARVSLSKALSDLRRQFTDHFEITTQAVRFRTQEPYWLDLDNFQGQERAGVGEATAIELQARAQLYRGDFLHGFVVRNAPEFELWMMKERDRLRDIAVKQFAALADLHQTTGDLDAALAGWKAVLTLERSHEAAHRAIMALLAATDNLHTALKQYEECCAALANELDVGPSPETVDLYNMLRAGRTTAESGEAPAVVTSSDATFARKAAISPNPVEPYPSKLIGRQTAWQQLNLAWQRAQTRGSHCVLLCGEAGIGKSYLADVFVSRLETTDAVILRGRCYANDEYSTFSPIYDWMKDSRLQEVIQRLPNFVQQDIARFHPSLLDQNPQLNPPEAAILPYQKRRLFDSILAVLRALQRPIILYIDDMHWMDHETATWLHHALNSAQPQNVLFIIGTIRNESLAKLSAWSQWIKARQQDQLISQIYLHRLDLAESSALLKIVGNPNLDATVAASLFEISEGNPLFLIELVRAGWPHASGNGIPTQIEEVIHQRLRPITAELTESLQFAAVVGREFDYRLLFTCMDITAPHIVQHLEELCRLEIIQTLSETVYHFSHGLLQEVIYASLSAPRRYLFHQQIAHALIEAGSDSTKDASIIGKHFEEALCWQDAIDYYTLAGDTDFQVAAFETAEVHYQAAQRLTRQLRNRAETERIRAELLFKRGAVHSLIEPFPQQKTVALYTEAHRLCLSNQDDRGTWLALRGLWETRLNCNRIGMAKELSDQLLQLAQKIEAAELLFEASWAAGNTAFYQGRFAEADHLFERCITLYHKHGPFPHLTTAVFSTHLAVWIYQAFLALLQGHITKSREMFQTASMMVIQVTEVANVVFYESHRLLYAYFVRDIHYGMAEMDRVLQMARQSGLPMGIAVCSMLHFWFSALLDNRAEGGRVTEALLIREDESFVGSSHHLALYAQVYIAQNNFTRAQEIIALCAQNVARCGDTFMISCLYHAEAQCLRATGHSAEDVHAAYQRAIAAAQARPASYIELQIALDYASYLVEHSQPTVARDLLQDVLTRVERVEDNYYVNASLRLIGNGCIEN